MSMPIKAKTKPTISDALTLEKLWEIEDFHPNDAQKAAILHVDGPLYLPAGPGSGKTRVLLWRTLNLIVFNGVSPDEIYLSTFTEKAAHQLIEGVRTLLSHVTNRTGEPYDISRMYVGTIHSLCNRILTDRRFSGMRRRHQQPSLLDEMEQYFFISRRRRWVGMVSDKGLGEDLLEIYYKINHYFGLSVRSKHQAVVNCIALFNRLSEECIDAKKMIRAVDEETLIALLEMYQEYRHLLAEDEAVPRMDFSLMQQEAYNTLENYEGSRKVFKHVIIDEYQDTNAIQEKLIFKLGSGSKNVCVVGDDDQALYRFRGATVENFVDFREKCKVYLGVKPTVIPLDINYRSRKKIVDLYGEFMEGCDWRREDNPKKYHRVPKKIKAFRDDEGPSVVASAPGRPEEVCPEIARLVKRLIDEKKVEDENQVAFLFPSLKVDKVRIMREALEGLGLKVYAPRAGSFLEVEEAVAVFGVFLQILGKSVSGHYPGRDFEAYQAWMAEAKGTGGDLMKKDLRLGAFVRERREEIKRAVEDYRALTEVIKRKGWELDEEYKPERMKRELYSIAQLSERAKKNIASGYLDKIIEMKREQGKPASLKYVLARAASLDWNLLDLFYRLCTFDYFKMAFDKAAAQEKKDEGPICNMGLISQYLAKFIDLYQPIITGELLNEEKYQGWFFNSYLYAIFRLGESEYENKEDPFPKGRIPFLTIHQAKGLEFPVVVFANPQKQNRVQKVEEIVHPLVDRQGEPVEKIPQFDMMRLFYVAMSRAQNLLVIPHWQGGRNRINPPLQGLIDEAHVTRISDFDLETMPDAKLEKEDLPKNYSFTGDYQQYKKCPRQYMVFQKYGFAASRSQTMFFGSLVHQTLEDLHQYLIARKAER